MAESRQFRQSVPTVIFVIVGIVMTGIGLLFSVVQPLIGVPLVVIGIGMPLAVWYLSTSYVITCAGDGFEVIRASRKNGQQQAAYRWADVASTRYAETTTRRDGERTTTGFFTVETPSGQAFQVNDSLRGFHDLIALVNARTPHLAYTWQRQTGVTIGIGPVAARRSAYQQVERTTPAAAEA